ncbi:hypothetical protein ACFOKI_07775 [Sphingomonas qilianensis]|uniref:Anti-sigma factor NepR domain-containing protein n=1 Tax=Sphingomonas qilianensis TaxID=1736690 RepID=A0ABU9XWQ7_9SPHN
MSNDRIVSIGLLSERDLERLGRGFTMHYPVPTDDAFADLIARLSEIDIPERSESATPTGNRI